MDTLKTVLRYDRIRLGRRHVARGRAWRIWGLHQPTDSSPILGERGGIEPWAGEII
jgi:hypothetical protein